MTDFQRAEARSADFLPAVVPGRSAPNGHHNRHQNRHHRHTSRILASPHAVELSDHIIADIARSWKIRDRGARADLAELVARNGITFRDTQRLLLSATAQDMADEIVRPQRVRGHRGLIRPLVNLHGEHRERWARRQLKRLAERLLLLVSIFCWPG
jgi:hypothetical protein